MKRKMVIIGISYILGLFFASFFTNYSLCIIAIISVVISVFLVILKILTLKALITAMISFFFGAFIYSFYTVNSYEPIIALANEETVFVGMVKSIDEYSGEKASYILDGVFENGTEGSVLCYTDNYDCRYGDYIRVNGTFSIPEKTYLYDSTEYYKGLSVFLAADYDCKYTVLYTGDHPLIRRVQSYREKLQRRIYALCGKTGGSLTVAMIFGERQGLDERIESAFYYSGIGPMLALSGFHLIMFNGLCNVIGRRTRLQRIMQFIMTVIMTCLFSLVSMWPISIVRAGIMLLISRGSCIFCRKSDPLSSLLISVVLLTCTNPYLIHNISFLLSVAGTFGVNSFSPWLMEKVPIGGWFGGILKTAASAAFITLCTMPICLQFFPEISLFAPVSNVIFAPMCILIMFLGIMIFFLGGEGFICSICGQAINAVSKLLTDMLLWMQSNIFCVFSSGSECIAKVSIVLMIMTAIVFIITKMRRMVLISIFLSVVVLFSGQLMIKKQFEEKHRIFVLGRNNGQVIVVSYKGRTDVIDFTFNNKNADHLINFLDERGIKSIDSLYLIDNVNASAALYNKKLSDVFVDMVLLSSDVCFDENSRICGQLPGRSDFCTITAPTYEIVADNEELTVNINGDVFLILRDSNAENNDSLCDYLVLGDKNNQTIFQMISDRSGRLLCEGNNIEIIIDDEDVYARRLY